MLNQCNFIGRLGKEPEVRETQAGLKVVSFSLAVSEKYKGQETTEWVNCVVFDKLAGIVEQYLHKGDLAYVSGKMKTRKWKAQDGNDRQNTVINVNEVKMLGGVRSQGETRREPHPGYTPEREELPF